MDILRTILVLRFSSIGDIVLSTSVLAALKRNFPNTRIDFVTLQTYASLLEGHPYINRLYCVARDAGYSRLKLLGKFFELEGYDLVIDLHNTLRSKIICSQLLGTPHLVYQKPRWNRFKLFQFHLNHFPDHSTQRQMYQNTIVELLESDTAIQPTCLYLAPVEVHKAKTYLRQHGVRGDYLAVVPGSAWRQKTWIKEYYRKLFKQIHNALKLKLVVLGGVGDLVCEKITAGLTGTMDLHGVLSLRDTLGILSGARIVMGSDTGLVHAAEALGIPVVMILGPTSYETGGGTNLDTSVTLQAEDLWCRPCSQNGRRPCYRSQQVCMETITPKIVFHCVNQLLSVA